jgi:DNA-binding transcriptional MerR regulator
MAPQEPIRKRTLPPGPVREIPDKLYFRIGEVAKLCEVPAYVLRFWEGEFPQLKPNKGGTGQRLYRRRDVEMALRIKTLLYDEGYTIPGARQAFKAELRSASKDPQLGLGGIADTVDTHHLVALQKELRELHALLSRPAAAKSGVQQIRAARLAPALAHMPKPKPEPKPFPKPQLISKPADPPASTLFDDLFPDA